MKKKMKKRISLISTLVLVGALLVGCGNSGGNKGNNAATNTADADTGAWEFERRIEIICPWGAGGGADTTLRTFASELEKELNVPVVINNKEGAGGVTGVDFAIKQPADGYTWLLSTQSPMLAEITGVTDVPVYEKTIPVSRLVHDVNIIIAGKNSPYQNLEELLAYVEENPGAIKAGCMSITGLDGAIVKLVFGDKVEPVAYSEGAQMNADVMGGHLPIAVVGPAEVMGLIQSEDIKVLAVCAEERLTTEELKDVQCTGELGIDAFYGPARGIFAVEGTPQEAIDAFDAAAKKAVATEEFKSWAASQGLDQRPGYLNHEDYKTWWAEEYEGLKEALGS